MSVTPWSIIQAAIFGYTGCDGDMADRTASAIENLLEQAGYDITPIDRQPAPASGEVERLREALRLFPEAHDVLTRQEMRDAKGNWRSLIDQQTAALKALRALSRNQGGGR